MHPILPPIHPPNAKAQVELEMQILAGERTPCLFRLLSPDGKEQGLGEVWLPKAGRDRAKASGGDEVHLSRPLGVPQWW